MDTLHRAYVAFTEHWWLPTLAISCVSAVLVAPKRVPLVFAFGALIVGFAAMIGWMVLDLVFFPESHNLLPFEACFKLLLLAPLALSIQLKRGRNIAE